MGDRSDAVALEIAERKLVKMGYRWGPKEVAMFAAEVLLHLEIGKREGMANYNKNEPSDG